MAIIINIDVMLAKRKMSVGSLGSGLRFFGFALELAVTHSLSIGNRGNRKPDPNLLYDKLGLFKRASEELSTGNVSEQCGTKKSTY